MRTSRLELPRPDGLFIAYYRIASAFKEVADWSIFTLALSTKCVQACLTFRIRMRSHSLLSDTDHVANIPRLQLERVCALCQTGNLEGASYEQHLVLKCLALLGLKDRYRACLGMMQLQWFISSGNMILVRLRTSSKNVWTHACAHTVILALRARHQISPRWLKRCKRSRSLSLSLSFSLSPQGSRHAGMAIRWPSKS